GEAPGDIDLNVAYGVAVAKALAATLGVDTSCYLESFLASYEDDARKARAATWGTHAARAVLRERANDGAAEADAVIYAKLAGSMAWTPTGPFFGASDAPGFNKFSGPLLPSWGATTPWVMKTVSEFTPDPFPAEESAEFARQFLKVKEIGGKDSLLRTQDQTEIAFFWEDGPRGVTPPGHWQIIAMDLMQRLNLDMVDQARYMAMLSLTQADAGIATWHCKFDLDIVRPETAIRRGGFDNRALVGARDPQWETLIPTPPFPAYVSGHSAFSASSARILERMIGTDDVAFSGAAPDLINWPTQLTGVKRYWRSLSHAAEEGGMSREYGGIHWEADNTEGMRLGAMIADLVFESALPRQV
ncbi:MAG: vanadium-dependent haloperoxidase, partial [Pseudomonadota bacterium]